MEERGWNRRSGDRGWKERREIEEMRDGGDERGRG